MELQGADGTAAAAAVAAAVGPLDAQHLFQLASEQQGQYLASELGIEVDAGSPTTRQHLISTGLSEGDILNRKELVNEVYMQQQQRERLQQLNDLDDPKPADFYEPPPENVRPERSNSCSGADCAAATRALSAAAQLAEVPPSLACSLTLLSSSSPLIDVTNGTAASVSQLDLASQIGALSAPLSESSQISNVTPIDGFSQGDNLAQSVSLCDSTALFHFQLSDSNISTDVGQPQSPKPTGSLPAQTQSGLSQQQSAQQDSVEPAARQQPAPTRSSNSSGSFSSSRFFPSKLNTGSLWSLLSVGSSTSMHAINEIASPEAEHEQNVTSTSNRDTECEQSKLSSQLVAGQQRETSSTNNKQQQLRDFTTRSASNFFNQFKSGAAEQQKNNQQLRQHNSIQPAQSGGHQTAEMGNQDSSTRSSRYRFNVKYIGSAMLHKNFTLPMLEWITKDIRRQTIRAASGVNQRQFTIPIRDIMLEIRPKQLVAISCKDGHCIFVHPMACVSKYAQLQRSPSSFAYIIRDNKESPSFCHFFQAKSADRVHEIFMAIREVTTRNQFASLPSSYRNQPVTTAAAAPAVSANQQASLLRLQKSASSDGRWLSSFDGGGFGGSTTPSTTANTPLTTSMSPPVFIPTPASSNFDNPQPTSYNQQQQHKLDATISLQFENSYQFEVMFVKRVKLQCRRVPATFVDDALETLKTFEVPKATQIKGKVTKRIIGASVDERQEYDELSQPGANQSSSNSSQQNPNQLLSEHKEEKVDRRGSSVSLRGQEMLSPGKGRQEVVEGRESKSCQQSPAKSASGQRQAGNSDSASSCSISRDDLASTDESIIRSKMRQSSPPPTYTNDFSPYSTITSSDLNERIAAIPVVSGSSVSLDHETRQKLARQVRETIMATAANIKKDVYASGDRLDASNSSKVLDSLSCTGANLVDAGECRPADSGELHQTLLLDKSTGSESEPADQRRFSLSGSQQQSTNNFDLFRRASARHVVKNRTMLLLIGKDELCAISIDKHQMLFNKSFNSIVHCLSGSKNQDHFGLICRDSGKINPQTESYAGFVFKCQSEKVVREIMAALKQVIYSSQHNYHGYNSPYNPLNSISNLQLQFNANSKQQADQRQRVTAVNSVESSSSVARLKNSQHSYSSATTTPVVSMATKKGLVTPLDLESARQSAFSSITQKQPDPTSFKATGDSDLGAGAPLLHQPGPSPPSPPPPPPAVQALSSVMPQMVPAKNPIKSMFCDDCPLYWFHRLCCDIESLPAEASKTIILRRIDSSLSEREQDEVFTKFSDYKIESIEDHNEIFMSLLRHLCERKQGKHSQTHSHQYAIAKNASLAKKQSSDMLVKLQSGLSQQQQHSQQQSQLDTMKQQQATATSTTAAPYRGHHQRSGSSGGSLALIATSNSQAPAASLADASSVAIDNLKRAKNSISVSIENLIKRRSSLRDDRDETENFEAAPSNSPLMRTSSFKSTSRETRQNLNDSSQTNDEQQSSPTSNNLRRSQSTSDYPQINSNQQALQQVATWRDSLTKTLNSEELTNPLANFFRRRGSFAQSDQQDQIDQTGHFNRDSSKLDSKRTSTESLSANVTGGFHSPRHNSSRVTNSSNCNSGQSTPLHLLSGSFWKKSIFDMVQKTSPNQNVDQTGGANHGPISETVDRPIKRSRSELRELWKKAIREQITLLKMDKQNQKLMSSSTTGNRQTRTQSVTSAAAMQTDSVNANRDIDLIKLNYEPVSWSPVAQELWNRILKQDPTKKVQFAEVARLVRLGVPMMCRGEVWMFLMNQYQLRYGTSFQPVGSDFIGDANQTYRGLLSQLSTQQHEIFVDIGRTFPSHPYYSQYLSIGQLSLFNLLKAYSLLDRQVGYCQGLSFVAGILLLHVDSEDEAFELMRHLMFNFGLRKQYLPSMEALHLQLYQMTRLLRDHEFQIFDHFDKQDISPSLYAAPWFLTLFASQFPLGFVARLLDLVYLIGIEAIFRVSLTLLAYHRASIIECSSLELTMDFMRDGLTKIDDKDLVKIFNDAFALDLRNKLIEYEIEYSFYCAEDKTRNQSGGHHHHHRGQSSKPAQESSRADQDTKREQDFDLVLTTTTANDSAVADATATVIIQHLLSNNHLRSLRSNYSY